MKRARSDGSGRTLTTTTANGINGDGEMDVSGTVHANNGNISLNTIRMLNGSMSATNGVFISGRLDGNGTINGNAHIVDSFLDPGTESLPGESHQQDYAVPVGYSPLNVIANTPAYHRSPLPGPFDLPSQRNPWPWGW